MTSDQRILPLFRIISKPSSLILSHSRMRAILILLNLRPYSRVRAIGFLAHPCLRHGPVYVIRYVPYLLADVRLALWCLVVAPIQTFPSPLSQILCWVTNRVTRIRLSIVQTSGSQGWKDFLQIRISLSVVPQS